MLRTLLTTTALAALLTTGAMAQDAAKPADQAPAANQAPAADAAAPASADSILAKGYTVADEDNLATHVIGAKVYSSAQSDAEHIGDVNDLVLNKDGTIAAVIIGVGGFLGIGEKNVAVNFKELQWTVADDNSERFVLPTTKDALNAAPAFEAKDDEANNANNNNTAAGNNDNNTAANNAAAPADANNNAMAPADNNNAAAATADQNATAAIDATQLTDATLTADELEGTTAYGPNNENLGKIGDVLLAQDGKTVDAVIIDFGGFLGIGTKQVAVGFDTLKFQQDQNGNRFVRLNVTREQLDQAPEFDEDTYAQDPNKQRLVIQG